MEKEDFSSVHREGELPCPDSVPHKQSAMPAAEEPLPPVLSGDELLREPQTASRRSAQDARSDDRDIEEAFRRMTGEESSQPGSDSRPAARPARSNTVKILLVSLCALLLVILVGTIGFLLISSATDPYNGLILSNVTIADVNVGGMTRSDAEKAVSSAADPLYSAKTMVITLPEGTLELAPSDSGIRLDVRAAVKAAYAYGRTGSKEQRQEEYDASLVGNHTVSLLPYLKLDERGVRSLLNAYAEEHVSVYAPSSYALEGTMPELSLEKFNENAPCQTLMLNPGNPGGSINVDQVYDRLLQAYADRTFTLRVEEVDADTLPAPLDLPKIHSEFYIEPVDSTLDMEEYQVIPGSYGYTFDLSLAQELLEQAEYGETVKVPMEYVAPELMEDDVLYQDVLGAYVTPHGTNENRNNNLRLACEALDGLILYPGDEFSFNETLGQRTAEKGYKPAPAYSGTTLVPALGGGICQVSSTLYSSCLLADMEIVFRINHGFPPTYMDKGMDATVSWGSPDFQFRNSSNFPIKLRAETTDEEVRIQILGTDERDYYVKMETEITSITDPPIEYEVHEPGGQYKDGDVISGGTTGYYVKTYKCKYDKETDELISRDYEASSSYQTKPRIIASVKDSTPPTEEVLPVEPQVPPASSEAAPDPT